MMKSYVILFLAMLCLIGTARSQKGLLQGHVKSEQGEVIPFANVQLFKASETQPIRGVTTDFDGKYSFANLDSGKYDMQVSYVGYTTHRITDILVKADRITTQEVELEKGINLEEVQVISYKKPLFEMDQTTVGQTVTREEFSNMAVRSSYDVAKTAGNGTFSRDDGTGYIHSRGGRASNSVTYVDGVKIIGATADVPGENYAAIKDNDFQDVARNPLSTISIDVDKASYSNVRRFLNQGYLPPADAIRIEEMINYFHYAYPQPSGEHPISVITEMADCPWNPERKLVHIGIQGKAIPKDESLPNNLVFLIDVSGSMSSRDKLPLLQSGLELLVDQLREEDKISLVVYAGNAGVVLKPTSGDKKAEIKRMIRQLRAGGSTAGGAGIKLAYDLAEKHFLKKGNNRVILATDGDFNVGISSQDGLVKLIEEKRASGIYLSVLGFGTGNLQDAKMEQLADKGNGNYHYIDQIREAKKVLVTDLMGTILTVAKDVKVQAEFNPAQVKAYRLIGYVNRKLNAEDFNDDSKDAGELGAGASVTVIYEIIPANSEEFQPDIDPLKYQGDPRLSPDEKLASEVLTVKFRYKEPDEEESKLLSQVLAMESRELAQASSEFQFATAVASFGIQLRKKDPTKSLDYKQILALAKKNKGVDEYGYRAEFIHLVETAQLLD